MFAWRETGAYRPSDFEGTFPNDLNAGKQLEEALLQPGRNRQDDAKSLDLFRQGLRGLRGDRQMPALRWCGNAFIWNQSPQDPKAIELMYHAAGSTNPIIYYNAIYYGLSTVRPMTEPILRTLIDVAMGSEDPNLLSRIAWGTSAQKDQLLQLLQPYLAVEDSERRRHADALRQIFSGEVEAFAWAEARTRKAAEEKFSGRLDQLRDALANGDSARRRETLDLIQNESIALIMDDSFIGAFAKCAADGDVKVRDSTVIQVGSRWIWGVTNQHPEAIELMLRFSHDSDRKVRYNAMYYGFSTIQNRDDVIIRRMIEMLGEDGLNNRDFRQRIFWGWKQDHAKVRAILEKIMNEPDLPDALFAYGLFLDLFAERPPDVDAVQAALRQPDKPVAHVIAIAPTAGAKFSGSDDFINELLSVLPVTQSKYPRWSDLDGLPFTIAPKADIDAIKKSLLQNPHFKLVIEKPVSAQSLVTMGKEGSFILVD